MRTTIVLVLCGLVFLSLLLLVIRVDLKKAQTSRERTFIVWRWIIVAGVFFVIAAVALTLHKPYNRWVLFGASLLLATAYPALQKRFDRQQRQIRAEERENDERSAWAAMPHRRLAGKPRIDLIGSFGAEAGEVGSELGEVVNATIAQTPPGLSDKVFREHEICPVCGASTAGTDRVPCNLYPKFANGFSFGLGVWVHGSCLEGCPEADESPPVPW